MPKTPEADTRDVLTGWSLIDETDGFDVDNDVHDDPVLVGPDGQPVDTWREDYPYDERMTRREYEVAKRAAADRAAQAAGLGQGHRRSRLVMVFEGRDAAGKGGTIKRFTEHLNPRGARVVALEKPTDAGARAVVLPALRRAPARRPARSCCSTGPGTTGPVSNGSWASAPQAEYLEFMRQAPEFERMLVRSGIHLIKFWFSVTRPSSAPGS